jgi:glycosyltransferase involved in cell wall biosynthesis
LAKDNGIEFSLVTGRTKFLSITRNIKKFEDAGFLKVYRLGPNPADVIHGAFMYTLGYSPKLVEKMKFSSLYHEAVNQKGAQSADLFHIHGIWGDLEYINLGIYLSRHFNKPLIVTLHGGFVGDPLQGGMPLESTEVRNILKNDAAAITTYSKEVLGTLQKLGLEKKSYLLTNFVDTSRFKKTGPAPPHDLTMIYVGRLEPVQTPEIVVKAFKQVHERFPKAKLIIVGYGTLLEYLKDLAKELNIEGSVIFTGKQTDVRKYLWSSDVFVATNFGYIATLEAWSAGLAVVAPKFGVLKETISHEANGLLVEPANLDDLASALLRLAKDSELRRKLAAKGVETVKNYDVRSVVPKMSKIYRSILEN